jgi:hypothetical protein
MDKMVETLSRPGRRFQVADEFHDAAVLEVAVSPHTHSKLTRLQDRLIADDRVDSRPGLCEPCAKSTGPNSMTYYST